MPPIAVLAGGLATRLGDLTRAVPKSMLVVAGKPFIVHQLALFRRQGIRRVTLCVGHLSAQLYDFVGDGARFGLEVTYSADGPALLGTGGAIRKALAFLGPEFLVTYGDSYLDIDYRAVVRAFQRSGKRGLMTVMHNDGRWDTSNVEFDNGHIVAYSKRNITARMHHIDYGLAMLKAEALTGFPADHPFDLADAYGALVSGQAMDGYLVTKRFYEIGSHVGLKETDAYLRRLSTDPDTHGHAR